MSCDWIEVSKGLLTPAIGFVAIYIAWQQWNTNRNKLKLDLFEKRFSVFQSTRTFLSSVLRDGLVSREVLETYRTGILDAVFLFDQQTSDYLWGLHKAGLKAIKYKSSLEGVPVGEKRNQLVEQEGEQIEVLTDALGGLQKKFEKFLKLGH